MDRLPKDIFVRLPRLGEAGNDLKGLMDQRFRASISEAQEWRDEYARAVRYYQSKQWDDMTENERDRIIPITLNVIRQDLNRMVNAILDAEPIVSLVGRNQKDYDLVRMLVDTMKWTREEEDNWKGDLEDALRDGFHVGEGILWERWNWSLRKGQGMPEAEWVDPRFCAWDTASRKWQREDASWQGIFVPQTLDYLEGKYPEYKDKLISDVPDFFGTETEGISYNQYNETYRSQLFGRDIDGLKVQEPQAYERIMWHKRVVWEERYLTQNGRPALDEQGEPLNEESYKALDRKEKKEYRKIRIEHPEIWETICINDFLVKNEIADFDESLGGHGQYPLCFFQYVRLRNRSRAMGEIAFLTGLQDFTNRMAARWLEQLMVAGFNFLSMTEGSMPKDSKERLRTAADNPFQIVETFAGFESPKVVSGNPGAAQLFNSGIQSIIGFKDIVSGVRDINRGQMPYETSGKGIRALQSEVDLLGVSARAHVEAFLRQSALLRAGNILQNMTSARMVEVADDTLVKGGTRKIYIGDSLEEIQQEYDLMPLAGPDGMPLLNPDGSGEPLALADPITGAPANVLVLDDETRERIDWRRLRYELDTGRERNAQERAAFAETILQYAGPAALPWAVELMKAPNADELLERLRQTDEAQGFLGELEKLSKDTGVPVNQLIQMVMEQLQAAVQQLQQAEQGGGAPPAPPGAPTPPAGPVPPEALGVPPEAAGAPPVPPPGVPV